MVQMCDQYKMMMIEMEADINRQILQKMGKMTVVQKIMGQEMQSNYMPKKYVDAEIAEDGSDPAEYDAKMAKMAEMEIINQHLIQMPGKMQMGMMMSMAMAISIGWARVDGRIADAIGISCEIVKITILMAIYVKIHNIEILTMAMMHKCKWIQIALTNAKFGVCKLIKILSDQT